MRKTAIIVDDEATLIDYLATKLAELWPELEILGSAQNGRQALALFAQEQPDIVFLDIHMPGLSGLQVADQLPTHASVVFVTAYDQYAVQAFERAAVDYLLKPVQSDRLARTIERLKDSATAGSEDLRSLLNSIIRPESDHLHWLRTGLDDVTELVSVEDVLFFKADQKYTSVVTTEREYVIRMSIKELAERLDPRTFWQIHRGIIVRVDEVVSAQRDLRGRYTLKLRSSEQTLRTSASYGHLFKHM